MDAFCLAGGPVPERGFCLGRELACFCEVRLGGPKVRRVRARCSDPGDAAFGVYETCFVGTLSEDACWWEDVSLDRFTTCPWRPFCLKPMLQKMCRDKPHSMWWCKV